MNRLDEARASDWRGGQTPSSATKPQFRSQSTTGKHSTTRRQIAV